MKDDKQEQPPFSESIAAATGPAPRRRGGEPGAAALTIVLWLLLADAAVETFMSRAPVRWWAGGVVAAYLALAILLLWEHGRCGALVSPGRRTRLPRCLFSLLCSRRRRGCLTG